MTVPLGSQLTNQNRPLFRECVVHAVTPITVTVTDGVPSFSGGTLVSLVGEAKSASFSLKRKKVSVKAGTDSAQSYRAESWDTGDVTLEDFSLFTGSHLMALFAGGAHVTFQFTEYATGDSYWLTCFQDSIDKKLGEEPNMDSLKLSQEGVPYWATAGSSTPVAMTLDY